MSNDAQTELMPGVVLPTLPRARVRTLRPAPSAPALVTDAARGKDRGRRLILWGWLVTMVGVGGYCRAMFRSSADSDVLTALREAGLTGWGSIALIALGIAIWLFGNVALLKESVADEGDKH